MTTRRKRSWQINISKRRCLWVKIEIKTSYNSDWNRLMMNKVCFLHFRLWITSWHDQEINRISSSILIFELENVLMNNSIKRRKIDDSTFKDDIHSNMSNDTKKTTTMIQTNKCKWQTFCEIRLTYESKNEYQYLTTRIRISRLSWIKTTTKNQKTITFINSMIMTHVHWTWSIKQKLLSINENSLCKQTQ
jgi:hypothetical protein